MSAQFGSVEGACAYAYAIKSIPIVKVSQAIADLRQDHGRICVDGMDAHDHHHQSALILMRIDTLPPMRRVLIEGLFDRHMRYGSALALLDISAQDRLGRTPTLEYICQWLGERTLHDNPDVPISTRILSEKFGRSQSTHTRERKRIHDELDRQFYAARSELEDALKDMLYQHELEAA